MVRPININGANGIVAFFSAFLNKSINPETMAAGNIVYIIIGIKPSRPK